MLNSFNFYFMLNDFLKAYKEFWTKDADFKIFKSRSN